MTIKSKTDLEAQYADGQQQSITAEMHRDHVDSVFGVGGGEADSGVDPQGNGGARSIDAGNGLTPLGNRRFQVDPGADGLYRFYAEGQADIDIEANVFVAIVKNDIQPPDEGAPDFVLKRRMYPGAKNEASNFIYLFEHHNCVEGDIIELDFQETSGSNVSNVDYVFTGHRIG